MNTYHQLRNVVFTSLIIAFSKSRRCGIHKSDRQRHAKFVFDFATSTFTFNFSASALGSLPTHAGIVWTDIGRNGGSTPLAADLISNVTFEAFGPTGTSLGVIGPFSLGDSSISRTTEEDRFIGVVNDAGISAIRLLAQRQLGGRPSPIWERGARTGFSSAFCCRWVPLVRQSSRPVTEWATQGLTLKFRFGEARNETDC